MPNPLQILAGLAQVGASGTGGAYQGAVEAPFAKQQLQTGEIENQLRLLRGLALQQSLGPQYTVDNQGRILLQAPGQPPRMMGELPMGQMGQGRIDLLQSQAAKAEAQAAAAQARADKQPVPPSVEQQALEDWRKRPENQGKSLIDFAKEYHGATRPEPKQPASLESLTAKANDPTVPPEERARAKEQADAIKKTREDIARAGVQSGVDIRGKEKERAADVKSQKAFAVTETLLNQLESLRPEMKAKGFLAADPSAMAGAKARANRSEYNLLYGKPGDPTLTAWLSHEGTMIKIQRDLGDIGGRFKQAYEGAMRIITNPNVTDEGAKLALGQLRDAVTAYQTGRAAEYEAGGVTKPSQAIPGAGFNTAPRPQTFPQGLPDPATVPGQYRTINGEEFLSSGFKWDRVGPPQRQPAGRTAPGAAPSGGKRPAIGPNGETGFLPSGTDLSKYPGYRWAQ